MQNLEKYKHIFRSYDIRGIFGETLNEDVMKRIGYALAKYLGSDIVVARDGRESSPKLKDAFISGVLKAGKAAHDIDLVPLGAAVFLGWQKRKPVAYVTGSHLSYEWNGVKFFNKNGLGLMENEIMKIRDIFLQGENYFRFGHMEDVIFEEKTETDKKTASTCIDSEEVLESYKKYLLGKIQAKKKIKIVIDCLNGAASLIAADLFKRAGFEVEAVNNKIHAKFNNREPDPNIDKLILLREKLKDADFGIAYDGDGDRMVVLDDKGNKLSPEQISYIILNELLKSNRRDPIIANVECTKLIDEVVAKFENKVIRVPVGHTFLMEAAAKEKACFGVEVSGHYALPHVVPFDDALAVSLYFASILSERDKKLSEIIKAIPNYPFSRTGFDCDDMKKFSVMEKIKEKLKKKYSNINAMDGVRVDFENSFVLIRASNTGPKIKLTIEAKNEDELKELKDKFSKIIIREIENV